jgi:hypothetical protein
VSTRRPRAARPLVRCLVSSCLAGLFALLGGGCASTPPARPAAIEAPRSVSSTTILRPAADPEIELDAIARLKTTPALLRRAYLELVCRRPQAAIDAAAEVLYGIEKPGANEEAFARFLRAEGYAMQGKPERGTFDLDRARTLALDTELQRILGTSRQREATSPTGPGAPAVDITLAVRDRTNWSPRPVDRRSLEALGAPRRLTVHHSAMYFRDTNPAACAAQIQQIQREHMGNRGYGDIGYHFLIDPAGRIWEGRELKWQGAHASGDNNRQNIGICVLGNFLRGRGGQGPAPAQVQSLRQLTKQLMARYSFGPDAIHCHSDFKATECPGPLMESVVAQMIHDLQRSGGGRLAAAGAGH